MNASTFTLKTAAGTAVPATVAYDGATRTATLTPSSALAGGTAYTATLDDRRPLRRRDADGRGRELVASHDRGHRPPTVTGVSPADGATQVAVGTTVAGDVLGLRSTRHVDPADVHAHRPARAPSRPPWPTTTPTRTATLTPSAGAQPVGDATPRR